MVTVEHEWVQYGGAAGVQSFPGRKTYFVCRWCGVVKTPASLTMPCVEPSARPTAPTFTQIRR